MVSNALLISNAALLTALLTSDVSNALLTSDLSNALLISNESLLTRSVMARYSEPVMARACSWGDFRYKRTVL